jgi:drug/metabolite transporter (DMT)-like permease
MSAPPRSNALAYAALAFAAFSFGTNWIVGRGIAQEIPPAAITFWRWFFANALLLPFCLGRLRRDAPILRASWRVILVLALLGVGLFQLFAYGGLRFTTATNGALLNSAVPIFVVILGTLFFGHRLTPGIAIGVLLSLAGVVTIIVRGDLGVLLALGFNKGDLLVIAGMVVWAFYTIGLKWRPAGLDNLSFLGATFLIGFAFSGIAFAIEMALGFHGRYTREIWIALAALGLFPSLVAYLCWNYGVSRIGASRAGVFSHLIPVSAALMAIGFLGERLELFHFVGFALVLAGIYLTNRP